jgi:hypothetical protein
VEERLAAERDLRAAIAALDKRVTDQTTNASTQLNGAMLKVRELLHVLTADHEKQDEAIKKLEARVELTEKALKEQKVRQK